MIKLSQTFKDILPSLHKSAGHTDKSKVRETLQIMSNRIQTEGDAAVLDYLAQFDGISKDNFSFWVSPKEFEEAYTKVPPHFIKAVRNAIQNLNEYHILQKPKDWQKTLSGGQQFGQRFLPIPAVGLYVPGGRAPYPSTVLMNAVPALIANCHDIIIATPPQKDGKIAPQILVAAKEVGVERVLKVGGAQAIFGLAYGTQSIPKVDKIVGPGNIYVNEAKQMVYGQVDIDKPAGPSDVLVYIDNEKYVPFAAAELMAQLEHDPDNVAVGISESHAILTAVQAEMEKQVQTLNRKDIIKASAENSVLCLTKSKKESIDAINLYAPEHLALITDHYEAMIPDIQNAGAIFMGPYTTVPLGDFYAGTNHVLPTSGTARFASPLGVMDFMKFQSLLHYPQSALAAAETDLQILTEMEGFDGHFNAVKKRLS